MREANCGQWNKALLGARYRVPVEKVVEKGERYAYKQLRRVSDEVVDRNARSSNGNRMSGGAGTEELPYAISFATPSHVVWAVTGHFCSPPIYIDSSYGACPAIAYPNTPRTPVQLPCLLVP